MSLLKQQRGLMTEPAGLDKRQGSLAGLMSRAGHSGRMAMLAALLLVVTLLAMPGAAQAQVCPIPGDEDGSRIQWSNQQNFSVDGEFSDPAFPECADPLSLTADANSQIFNNIQNNGGTVQYYESRNSTNTLTFGSVPVYDLSIFISNLDNGNLVGDFQLTLNDGTSVTVASDWFFDVQYPSALPYGWNYWNTDNRELVVDSDPNFATTSGGCSTGNRKGAGLIKFDSSVEDAIEAGGGVVEMTFQTGGCNGSNNVSAFLGFAASQSGCVGCPSVDLLKSAELNDTVAGDAGVVEAGDEITYTFELINNTDGQEGLSNVSLVDGSGFSGADPFPSIDFVSGTGGATATDIPVGETATFEATYTLTQADIDEGFIDNQAVVNADIDGEAIDPVLSDNADGVGDGIPGVDNSTGGTGDTTGDDNPTRVLLPQTPELALVKTADTSALQDPAQVGEEIDYTFTVENTGNVTLDDIEIEDSLIDATDPLGTIATLAPGATDTSITATYAITQDDIDAGEFANTATAEGNYTDENGDPQTTSDDSGTANDNDDATVSPISQSPSMTLTKLLVPADQTYRAVGDELTYEITLENDGNVTIYDPEVTDTGATTGPTLASGDTNDVGVLDVGETWTYDATYEVVQADLNNGEYNNTAAADASADTNGDGTGNEVLPTQTDSAIAKADLAFITGRVFIDNGLGSGTPHNADVDGDEAGLGGITVSVVDNSGGNCSGAAFAQTTTNGNGDWSLSLDADDAGEPACLVAETPTGLRAVSESAGTVLGVGDNTDITLAGPDDAQMTFDIPNPGTTWQDVNFGKVGLPKLVPDNQGTVLPGNVVEYRHRFTAATAGTVDFELENVQTTPQSPEWSQLVRQDPSCNGEADANEPVTNVDVDAGDEICLIVRVNAPANVPLDAQHSVDLTATQQLEGTSPSLSDNITVTDLTTAQDIPLRLEKAVKNLGPVGDGNSGGFLDTDFQTRNEGEPCDVLRYEIRYSNNGTTPLAAFEVNDATPANTSLAAPVACPTGLPDKLNNCTLVTPNDTNNTEGYQGAVNWQFEGQLAPGEEGTVSYDVRIEGGCD